MHVLDQIEALEGGLLAQEILMRGFLTAAAMENKAGLPPTEFIDQMGRMLLQSMQNMTRPAGERSDRIWGYASEEIVKTIDQVKRRVEAIS